MSHKARITYQDLQRKPGSRRSISFSIAYVRVCEWANDPLSFSRPKPDILEKAQDHAERLGDQHILDKIYECYRYYEKTDQTPTPKLPKPTKEANEISREISRKCRQTTQPYSTSFLITVEEIDKELDSFLQDIESRGL